MPARFRILPSGRPEMAGEPAGAGGPLVERDVELGDAEVVRVGRRSDLELPLPFPALSAVHARLHREDGAWSVEDAGSTNGTWVAGERLAPGDRRPLGRGAELRLGNVRLRFEGDGAPARAAEGTGTLARRLVDDLFGGADAGAPSLRVVRGAAPGSLRLLMLGHPYVVGRSETCALPLTVDEVSREHAELVRGAEGVVVRDLGSKNGVSVGKARVAGQRRLADGDLLEIGPVTLAFDDPADRYLRQLTDDAPAPQPASPASAPPSAPPAVSPVQPTPPELAAAPRAAMPRVALVVGAGVLLLLAAAVAAVVLF